MYPSWTIVGQQIADFRVAWASGAFGRASRRGRDSRRSESQARRVRGAARSPGRMAIEARRATRPPCMLRCWRGDGQLGGRRRQPSPPRRGDWPSDFGARHRDRGRSRLRGDPRWRHGRAALQPISPVRQPAKYQELPSLYRPGHMRRRLDQLIEDQPAATGAPLRPRRLRPPPAPSTQRGAAGARGDSTLAVVSAALRDSIRIVDEAFRLEEEAICDPRPRTCRTVEGMQMAERLLDAARRVGAGGGPADRGDGRSRRLPMASGADADPAAALLRMKPTRRCGGRARWASRSASAASLRATERPRFPARGASRAANRSARLLTIPANLSDNWCKPT